MLPYLLIAKCHDENTYIYSISSPELIRGGILIKRYLTGFFPLEELRNTAVYGLGISNPWAPDEGDVKVETFRWRIIALHGLVAVLFREKETAQRFALALQAKALEITGDDSFFCIAIESLKSEEPFSRLWKHAYACCSFALTRQTNLTDDSIRTPFTALCVACNSKPAVQTTPEYQPLCPECANRLAMARQNDDTLLNIEKRIVAHHGFEQMSAPKSPHDISPFTGTLDIFAAIRIDISPLGTDRWKEPAEVSRQLCKWYSSLENAATEALTAVLPSGLPQLPVICDIHVLQGITLLIAAPLACNSLVEIFNRFDKNIRAQLCAGIAIGQIGSPYQSMVERADGLLAEARMKSAKYPIASSGDGFVQMHCFRSAESIQGLPRERLVARKQYGATITSFPMRLTQLKDIVQIVNELRSLGLPPQLARTLVQAIRQERSQATSHVLALLSHIHGELGVWFKNRMHAYAAFPWKRRGKDEWWTDLADILELYILNPAQ